MILTSYFGRLEALREAKLYDACVPICRHSQDWFPKDLAQRREITLAPPSRLISLYKSKALSWPDFTAQYHRDVLDHHDAAALVARLIRRAGDSTPVLLCYCGPDKPCHRHLVAQWLTQHGHDTLEWIPPGGQQRLC